MAQKRSVPGFTQKTHLHEALNDDASLAGIEVPESLKLPRREPQTRTFDKLTLDGSEQRLRSGQAGLGIITSAVVMKYGAGSRAS